jgi:hypothetical protein
MGLDAPVTIYAGIRVRFVLAGESRSSIDELDANETDGGEEVDSLHFKVDGAKVELRGNRLLIAELSCFLGKVSR